MHSRIAIALIICALVSSLPTTTAQQPASVTTIYVPVISANRIQPFGFETSTGALYNPAVYAQAGAMNANWVRLNTISWREAQPTPDSPINWNAPSFQQFEQEAQAASALGLQAMAIIDDHPSWATGNSSKICAAILDEYHDEFAAFVQAVVARYSQSPYFVRYWELGNEPDVDPSLLSGTEPFGCWGDKNDEYYGGERYGRMLRVVTPAIRTADPGAKVIFGGLLMDRPANTLPSHEGKPFNFLEGALRAGAAPFFDILAFHAYAVFYPALSNTDIDLTQGVWASRGGLTLGKVRFLRDVLQRYGVNKPIILNETGLRCWQPCGNLALHEQAQANHLIRSSMRAFANGVEAYIWYTLQGAGWQDSGLLDGNQQPRPAYTAMKVAIERLNEVRFPPQSFTGYGTGLEAYRFSGNNFALDVIWSVDATTRTITLPQSSFIAAYRRDGSPLTPAISGGNVTLNVGFENIYLKRIP
ncbi:cellulase family glycosylhydrolase [Chloroflexus sp.]|uniref:cellulase family glycosylhydrolase n=1 Tax=Chloroflexus sp. TaxID=1904827 RepID=UPI002FDB1CF2